MILLACAADVAGLLAGISFSAARSVSGTLLIDLVTLEFLAYAIADVSQYIVLSPKLTEPAWPETAI